MSESEESFIADPYYEPIISLPLVEIDLKENNETEIFNSRGKLFRLYIDDKNNKEWKERGVGDMRILKHNNSNQCRILMRREKILKLCANHSIYRKMKIIEYSKFQSILVWSTPSDLSEETSRHEVFAIRFEDKKAALVFKKIVNECIELLEKPFSNTDQKQKQTDCLIASKTNKDLKELPEKIEMLKIQKPSKSSTLSC